MSTLSWQRSTWYVYDVTCHEINGLSSGLNITLI